MGNPGARENPGERERDQRGQDKHAGGQRQQRIDQQPEVAFPEDQFNNGGRVRLEGPENQIDKGDQHGRRHPEGEGPIMCSGGRFTM